jgi:hypothetical protein
MTGNSAKTEVTVFDVQVGIVLSARRALYVRDIWWRYF